MMHVANMLISILVVCCQAADMTTMSPPVAPTAPSPEGFVADMPEEEQTYGEASWNTTEVLVMEWAVTGREELINFQRHKQFKELASSQAELLGSFIIFVLFGRGEAEGGEGGGGGGGRRRLTEERCF